MKNLWRALAITWLGGFASPMLHDTEQIGEANESQVIGLQLGPVTVAPAAGNDEGEERSGGNVPNKGLASTAAWLV